MAKIVVEITGELADFLLSVNRRLQRELDGPAEDFGSCGVSDVLVDALARAIDQGVMVAEDSVEAPDADQVLFDINVAAEPELASSALVLVRDAEPWIGKVTRTFWADGCWLADVAATWTDERWGVGYEEADLATWETEDLVPLTEEQTARWLAAHADLDDVEDAIRAEIGERS